MGILCALSFDGGAEIQQQFDEWPLDAGLGRVVTRYQHAHRGALDAVHVGEGSDEGANASERVFQRSEIAINYGRDSGFKIRVGGPTRTIKN